MEASIQTEMTTDFVWMMIYALSDFLIMILSWLVKQSTEHFCFRGIAMRNENHPTVRAPEPGR